MGQEHSTTPCEYKLRSNVLLIVNQGNGFDKPLNRSVPAHATPLVSKFRVFDAEKCLAGMKMASQKAGHYGKVGEVHFILQRVTAAAPQLCASGKPGTGPMAGPELPSPLRLLPH